MLAMGFYHHKEEMAAYRPMMEIRPPDLRLHRRNERPLRP